MKVAEQPCSECCDWFLPNVGGHGSPVREGEPCPLLRGPVLCHRTAAGHRHVLDPADWRCTYNGFPDGHRCRFVEVPPCDCPCHSGNGGAHPNEKCRCKTARTELRRAGCPTPKKKVYGSKADAAVAEAKMRRSVDVNGDLKPYLCDCGAWHLGHGKVRLRSRVRFALNRERYEK